MFLFLLYPLLEYFGLGFSDFLTRALYMGLFSLSFGLLLGYAGLLNFGHVAFYGIGAYITGWSIKFLGIGFIPGLVLAMMGGAAMGILLSFLVSREFHGIPFTFMSLAFGMILLTLFEKEVIPPKYSTGAGGGIIVSQPQILQSAWTSGVLEFAVPLILAILFCLGTYLKLRDSGLSSKAKKTGVLLPVLAFSAFLVYMMYDHVAGGLLFSGVWGVRGPFRIVPNKYFLTLTALVISYFVVSKIVGSPVGHVWLAIRENQTRAEVLGYRLFNYKLLAVVVSGAIAGLAGGLSVPQGVAVAPSVFNPMISIQAIIYVILGGLGTLGGPIFGAVTVIILEEGMERYIAMLNANRVMVVIGIIFVIVVYMAPNGLYGKLRELKERMGIF